eukprot:511046_1
MGNKHSKNSKKFNKQHSVHSYKNCKECWTYKKYRHCCYNVCFETIFNAHRFIDVLNTKWIFTNKHEIELYNILLPLSLEGIIPVISTYLPKKQQSEIQTSTTPRGMSPKANFLFQPTRQERALSVPYYTPDINISSSSYNTSSTDTSIHAYFHGYISLYNRNHAPCFTWMKTLEFDEYDDRESGPKKKKIQITILGDVGVGKSTLINRYLNNEFTENYTPTIVDCYTQTISLNDSEYEHSRRVFSGLDFDINEMEQNILDTAGGDVIAMAGSIDEWIEHGQIFLLCFDISRGLTLQYLKSYIIPRIQQHFEDKGKNEHGHIYSMNKSNHIGPCGLILVGCKVDLRNGKRKEMNVEILKNYNGAMRLAKNMNIPYIETSSKLPINVNF